MQKFQIDSNQSQVPCKEVMTLFDLSDLWKWTVLQLVIYLIKDPKPWPRDSSSLFFFSAFYPPPREYPHSEVTTRKESVCSLVWLPVPSYRRVLTALTPWKTSRWRQTLFLKHCHDFLNLDELQIRWWDWFAKWSPKRMHISSRCCLLPDVYCLFLNISFIFYRAYPSGSSSNTQRFDLTSQEWVYLAQDSRMIITNRIALKGKARSICKDQGEKLQSNHPPVLKISSTSSVFDPKFLKI